MSERFHEELKKLKKDVIEMGRLSQDMLKKSVESFKKQDMELASWVYSQKGKLADMDNNIEAESLRLIALYQPMAKDMRTIACCLKMITYLTRIGRYGKDIAKITNELGNRPHFKKLVSIPHMAQIVDDMVNDGLTAFDTENISLFKDFSDRDDTVDELRYSIFRECLSYMMEDQKIITQGIYYIMVARYLERCADHACKIAEKIYYMVTGEHTEIDVPDHKKIR